MSVVVSIISTIIKSIVKDKVENELSNELIGISVDDVSEKGISKINDFINNGKTKIENILSEEKMKSMDIPEDNIAYIVAEIKDLLSEIEITDGIFRQCKYNSLNLYNFLWKKYSKNETAFIECEGDVKKILFGISDTLIKLLCESKRFVEDISIQISNTVDDTREEMKKEFNVLKENYYKIDVHSQMILDILEQSQNASIRKIDRKNIVNLDKKFQNDKKEDYLKIWNSRLFLHMDNEENPVTLKDAFIMPNYNLKKSIYMKGLSCSDPLDKTIDKFINYSKTSTMLITGVPGIGKSTITSWVAKEYIDDERVIILRFRDWKRDVIEKTLLSAICNKLDCKEEDLENKVLVLDGFDEMKALEIRDKLLDEFFDNIKDFENFKCIITSRPAYIDSSRFYNVLELLVFDINRIKGFYKKITKTEIENIEEIKSNLDVLGIPVILYMAIMSNIDIKENPTKPELYNRIFSKKGGIFDKFFDGVFEYDNGLQILRNPENIKKYLDFLCKIAFKMFEKNALSLLEGEFEVPRLKLGNKLTSILEFPIKHLFESRHIKIEFIHKSIYEYFVSEYIYMSIYDGIDLPTGKLGGILGKILKENNLSSEILEFLKYKIRNNMEINEYKKVYVAFQLMLENGMTFNTGNRYKNIIDYEIQIFVNMLEILHLWSDYFFVKFNDSIIKYIRYNYAFTLTLSGIDLSGADLSGANLSNANLREANLKETNLSGANLSNANLSNANLSNANLREANLKETNLSNAKLTLADLREADLRESNLSGAGLSRTKLTLADLRKTDLRESNLSGADLGRAKLTLANLRKAKLREACLNLADLRGADLSEVDLRKASLSRAYLGGAILDEDNIKDLKNKCNLQPVKIYINFLPSGSIAVLP